MMMKRITWAVLLACPMLVLTAPGCGSGSNEAVELESGEPPAEDISGEAEFAEEEANESVEGDAGGRPQGCE